LEASKQLYAGTMVGAAVPAVAARRRMMPTARAGLRDR